MWICTCGMSKNYSEHTHDTQVELIVIINFVKMWTEQTMGVSINRLTSMNNEMFFAGHSYL